MYSDTQALNPEWPSARTFVGRYHADVSVDSPELGTYAVKYFVSISGDLPMFCQP